MESSFDLIRREQAWAEEMVIEELEESRGSPAQT
jgi:hypothetical protein